MKKFLISFLLFGVAGAFADTTFEINSKLPESSKGIVSTEINTPNASVAVTSSSSSPSDSLPRALDTTGVSRPLIGGSPEVASTPEGHSIKELGVSSESPSEGAVVPVKLFKTLEEASAAGVNPLKPTEQASVPTVKQGYLDTLVEKIIKHHKEIGLAILLAVLCFIALKLWSRRRSRNLEE